jgi:phytoene synthase
MPAELENSYRYCRQVARERARNFYYGFWLLPKERRDAFCAVYSFMRYCDDVADGDASLVEKARGLSDWREALERTLDGDYSGNEILPAFHDAVRRYQIPKEYFRELIAGAEMDLSVRSYRTFEDLYQYCYRVASVVGLCSLHIFGFQKEEAKKLAEQLGVAFQLTNILRDLRQDAAAGRVYLPLEDLERFRYSPDELAAGVYNRAFLALMRFESDRARSYYERAFPLIEMVEPESRPALWTLISIYRGILGVIERNIKSNWDSSAESNGENSRGNVFSRPAALSDMEKITLVLRAAGMRLRHRAGGRPDWRVRG